MSLYVLDASVVLKWFLPEPGFEAAQKLRRPDVECEAPDLLLLEACNALWKHVRRGAVDAAVADAAVAALAEAPITWRPADTLFGQAYALAIETGRTVYDCTYLALAMRSGAPLITAEAIARDYGVTVADVRAALQYAGELAREQVVALPDNAA